MQVKYVTKLFINTSVEDFKNGSAEPFCDIDLHLLNECGDTTVEIAQKLWDKLNRPAKALLIYDEENNRMMIAGSKA